MKVKYIHLILCIFILVSVFFPDFLAQPTDKAEAAGEIIQFNEISVPESQISSSRGPSDYADPSQDPNWYSSTMNVTIPAYNITNIDYNKVEGSVSFTFSNSYAPTRWDIYREALGDKPKMANLSRYIHGYWTVYFGDFYIYYSDGSYSSAAWSQVSEGRYAGQNGNVSSYYNGMNPPASSMTVPPGLIQYEYREYLWPDWPDSYAKDIRPFYPTGKIYIDKSKTPVGIRMVHQFKENYWTRDVWDNAAVNKGEFYPYSVTDDHYFPLTTNKKPNLTLTSQAGVTVMNDSGFSTFNLEGYVQDEDNDTVDVIAEIPNVFYKKITLSNTASPKNFSIPIDVLNEGIPPGSYTVNVKAVDPFKFKDEKSTSFNVTNRLRNKAFFLINSPIDISESYSDVENDPQYAVRYKYEQDPNFFDNSMGMISDSGLWRGSKYTSFPYSGAYVASFQSRDNPLGDDRFDEFRMWSLDNLSSMTFLVHRKPIALFSAKLVNGSLQLTDSSFDLDHQTSSNKGLIDWQWQYKKTSDEVWTDGAPSSLPTSDQYDIRLRVRDIDGPNSIGVWSDWFQTTVGSSINHPPVALFTVTPNNVSYRKATTIEDKSFDPDNDPLDTYEWRVVKDGWQQVWYNYGGATTPPNIAGFGVGSYQVTLKVHDNRGLWSEPYSQSVQVINHPPVANFSMPNEVYRDTPVTLENLTPDPDEDGDTLSYNWYSRLNASGYYWMGNNRNQNFTVGGLIAQNGISDKAAISDGWEMRLNVSDNSLTSYATRMFAVKNHVPSAAISGPANVYQYDTKTFTSADEDEDSADRDSLQYYWRVMDSGGKVTLSRNPNLDWTFDEVGVYTLEHWAVDQIGDKSNIASLKVNVAENMSSSMTLTSPAGTVDAPSIIDAEVEGDPTIKWNYSDPEDDPQEKYRLEFFTKDSLLAKSVENTDSSGNTRQLKMLDHSFERFLFYSVQGRTFSKYKWSDISNEKAFIIDNPPVPGFTLITDTGKDATAVPIYRTDILQVTSTAHDEDEPKGDSLTYQYFLKKSGETEGLLSTSDSFTKQFATNGTFTIRQTVTDSLGLSREVSHALTVVNRIPVVNLTFPTSDTVSKPTIASTLTPTIKWSYSDEDGDEQQRFQMHILDAATNGVVVESPIVQSSSKQWTVPANVLTENQKYAVQVTVYDGNESEGFGSATSPRKYLMVNLLSVKGGVKHTEEWNANRQNYNLKQSGDPESPRAYNVFWAGEKFVLQADATGLPDTIQVTMDGGYTTQLTAVDEDKKLWVGELYDSSFENLPNGPVTFTFTAQNEYNTKIDKVTIIISENWGQYYRSHRVK